MKASELILLLQQWIMEKGEDPEVYAQDGMDPSDPSTVIGIRRLSEWCPAQRASVEQPGKIEIVT